MKVILRQKVLVEAVGSKGQSLPPWDGEIVSIDRDSQTFEVEIMIDRPRRIPFSTQTGENVGGTEEDFPRVCSTSLT